MDTVETSVLLPGAGLQGGNQTMRTSWIRWGGMEKEQEHSGAISLKFQLC